MKNIFDDETFFNGYKKIREGEHNYNNLIEQPAIKSLLPSIQNKKIVDLGCGYGGNCKEFVLEGAKKVTGIDISEKMLEVAINENFDEKIEYINLDMQEINILQDKYDLVFSSLAFHYVKDFQPLIKKIYNLLNKDGVLLFSQEHPITTAPKIGPTWTKDSENRKIFFNLCDYMKNGERRSKWLIDDIEKYHRTISELINTLINENFIIEKIVEPIPNEKTLEVASWLDDELEKPTAIIIKARKR